MSCPLEEYSADSWVRSVGVANVSAAATPSLSSHAPLPLRRAMAGLLVTLPEVSDPGGLTGGMFRGVLGLGLGLLLRPLTE